MLSRRERELKAEVKRLKKKLQEYEGLMQKTALKLFEMEAAYRSLGQIFSRPARVLALLGADLDVIEAQGKTST